MRINDVPKFIAGGSYCVDVEWRYLDRWLETQTFYGHRIDTDPDFQRGHVWSTDQQVAYVEYIAREGISSKVLQWNHPDWQRTPEPHCDLDKKTLVLVDGKQRLRAVQRFMANEIPAFGHLLSEYEDRKQIRHYCGFKMAINNLQTRRELLEWYLQLNAGGVVHTPEEISRVRKLLEHELATKPLEDRA